MISNIANLVQTCMNNMSLSSDSEAGVSKEMKHFIDQTQNQIQEISAQIEALEDGELPNEEKIKSQAINIFTEMRNHEEFKQFGVNNYVKFVSEYLKMSDKDLNCILKLELKQQEKKPAFDQVEGNRHDIDKLLQEIKEKEAILEEMEESIEQFKSQVISALDPTKFEGLSRIYNIFLRRKLGSEKYSKFELDLNQKEDGELVQLLQGYSLPLLEQFTIKRLPNDLDILREFILGCFSSCVNQFILNSEGEKRKIGDILDILGIISQNTSSGLGLHNFQLSTSDLKRVLELSKDRQKILGIDSCILKFDLVPKFKNFSSKSKLKTLYFKNGGLQENSDWGNYPARFSNLCKGLSQYFSKGFKIKELCFYEDSPEDEKMREIPNPKQTSEEENSGFLKNKQL